jgi:protein-disulfide isomerase
MRQPKKLIVLLIIFIACLSLIFYKTIKKTSGITIKKTNVPIVSQQMAYVTIFNTDQIYGNPGAPITIIEFSDFNCKKCRETHFELVDFINKNPTQTRLIWKSAQQKKWFSSNDPIPHLSAYCAGQQNKFWQFVSSTIANGKNTSENGLKITAQNLKLDLTKWWSCVNSNEAKQAMASSTLVNSQLGINSAPTLFVNNRWVNLDTEIKLAEILKMFAQ